MKRQLSYGFILLLALGFLLKTCNKDYFDLDRLSDEVELEPELAAPLIFGSMSMKDIVELVDSLNYTEWDEEGLIYIVYSDTAYTVRADTMVDVPPKLVSTYYIESDINIPLWLATPVGDTATFYKHEKFTFELDGNDRVDSVLIKGGRIVLDVNSSFEHTGLLTISSSQILDTERDTFSTVVNISDMSGSFSFSEAFDSDGYCLKSDIENDTSFIQINFRLELINSGNLINPDDQCQIDVNFDSLDFYKVFGFIDSRDLITESGAFEIPIFADNPDLADVELKDPRFNIFTSNSVGIPIEVELDNVIATSSRDGSTLELTFNEGIHPFEVGAPTIAQIGETVESEIKINRTTSNIHQLLALAPSDITYEVKGRTKAGTVGDQHFILDTSRIKLALEAVLPLDLRSSGFAFRDTLELRAFSDTAEGGLNADMIELAQVSLKTTNKLPIQLGVQVYLLDETYMVLDSVFDQTTVLLGAASVDENGKSVQASVETNNITFPSEKIARLKDVWYARFEARIITTDEGVPFVKLYIDDTLDFELSMYANFRINTREL